MTLTQSGYVVGQLVAVYALMSTTLNGLLNPFVYCALSRQYRDGYFRLLSHFGKWCGLQGMCKSKNYALEINGYNACARERCFS